EAAEFIKNGGIVAFPTETVFGLGANVFDETAIAKIFIAKNRPNDNPLIAHVSDESQISSLVSTVNKSAEDFINAFFPAPLTLVLQKSSKVPLVATANLQTIGVRMPRHDLAREFIERCGVPLVAPSANLSGKPSPTTWQAVYQDLNGKINAILQGSQGEIGIESTVVDCTTDVPQILRLGAITLEDLRRIAPETIFANIESNKSPGLRHKHYAPNAKVILVKDSSQIVSSRNAAFIGIEPFDNQFEIARICHDIEDYARNVFEFFRECDARNISKIYCQTVDEKGFGAALMDRLKRAAQ
ncbi:MAG: threonylcarbamoyl-AMP synthase, partial [Pyrinomonadaceae bacterium]|nr:threonylcarbamoyl-AMP synthase [Pyrinomonadaceae bacterium]